ncbi:MAG: hypothetical protein P1P84_25115, partial [Deferrisomatales bacterium]|nr:hypothetical protein [Deferrisomatales bacterium]
MFDRKDREEALGCCKRGPQLKVRLELTEITDTIREVLGQLSRWDNEYAADYGSLEDANREFVQRSVGRT